MNPARKSGRKSRRCWTTALGQLGEKDHNAVVLRFFENKSMERGGRGVGASEDAAKMRVNRALEKLRQFFLKRGVARSARRSIGR